MNSKNRSSILLAMALSLTAAASYGTGFDFSYTFHTGDTVSGTFDGTRTGNLISDISDTAVTIDGVTLPGTIFDESFSGAGYVDGGATVSLDGTDNNFFFVNSDYAAGDQSYTGYFGSISGAFGSDFIQASGPTIFGNVVDMPVNSSWSVTAVPEGGATLSLLGLGIAGLACFGRRKPAMAGFSREG